MTEHDRYAYDLTTEDGSMTLTFATLAEAERDRRDALLAGARVSDVREIAETETAHVVHVEHGPTRGAWAVCSCGWYGPMREDPDDAYNDQDAHVSAPTVRMVTVTLRADDAVWVIESAYRAKIAAEAARNPRRVADRDRAARNADETSERYRRVLDAFDVETNREETNR